MPQKIIFLDIDGPMIPDTSFLFNVNCSFEQELDERCVKILRRIVDDSKAKIVFNSTHNAALYESTHYVGLLKRFVEAGFKDDIHETLCTAYPEITRMEAITKWLSDYGEDQCLWVAFDDEKIDHKRAFLVDQDTGLGLRAYIHAANYLHFKKPNWMLGW